MSAQVALKAHLNALLDNAAKDRAEEAPEAWANLEKIVRRAEYALLWDAVMSARAWSEDSPSNHSVCSSGRMSFIS